MAVGNKSFQLEIDGKIPVSADFAGFIDRNPGIVGNLRAIALFAPVNVDQRAVAGCNRLGRNTEQHSGGMEIISAGFTDAVVRNRILLRPAAIGGFGSMGISGVTFWCHFSSFSLRIEEKIKSGFLFTEIPHANTDYRILQSQA